MVRFHPAPPNRPIIKVGAIPAFCYNTPMSIETRTVLVDMDGVMADFDAAALATVPHEKIVEKSEFYIAHNYPADLRASIEKAYNAPGFFESLEPMPGLLEGWQAMTDAGYSPRVASAPLSSNRTAVEGKIKWLDRIMVPEFGVGIIEDAVIDKDKWKYPGLALIDDRPNVARGINGEDKADWQHILFGWSHRADMPLANTAFRLLNWHDTPRLLETLNHIETMKRR